MSLAENLVSLSEQCAEFVEFKASFGRLSVQSWLTPREMALHFAVGAFLVDVPVLVEIGTFEGASALFTAAGIRKAGGGMLFSVDPHMGTPPYLGAAPWQFTLHKFENNVDRLKLRPYVRSLVSDSGTAAAMWPARPINSVLIDADHSFFGALKDFEFWAPKLTKGGLILIDDADDPALPELLEFVEMLKEMSTIRFDALVDGIAVFQRNGSDVFELIADLGNVLRGRKIRRPWDMRYVQELKPVGSYQPERISGSDGLRTAYQLGFLARCGHGDYGISEHLTSQEYAVVKAIADAREDGHIVVLKPESELANCRMVFTTIDQVRLLARHLLPGGLMIGRSSLPPSYENSIAERKRLLAANLEACGWSGDIHWGIANPHRLSMDAIADFINRDME